ncbi:hypothetical protein FNV43_RR25673 [Rhamnella rubrinervis]|uniref:Prolamin-like domain-containing protein n=1 Tax=Rhamnella rubrinervis TaxID=2594499 RepID=A0A8K0DL84_9ROSA|nr:hypothetical protein FNV43_RR25673 [Rhamnella rubrinervis]
MEAKLIVAVAVCVIMVFQVQPGQAQFPLPPSLGPIPGLAPPLNPGNITKCLSSIINVEGCLVELYKSLYSGQFGNLGSACCKAFLAIDDNCLPTLFPLNPLFPELVKSYCAQFQSGPSETLSSLDVPPASIP